MNYYIWRQVMSSMKFLRFLTSNYTQNIVTFLDNLSFIIGNFLLYILFSKYLTIESSFIVLEQSINLQPLLFLIISIIAFLIVGKNILHWKSYFWLVFILFIALLSVNLLIKSMSLILIIAIPIISLYWYYSQPKKKEEFKQYAIGIKNKVKTYGMFCLVFPRILFFNVAHYLFPLLFIWIALYGLAYLFGFLTINDFNVFISLMSLLGIIFGFFQYYVKGYKKNIQDKLVKYVTKLTLPKKFSIEDFKKYIKYDNKYKSILDLIEKNEKPKPLPTIKHSQYYQFNRILKDIQEQAHKSDMEIYKLLEEKLHGNKELLLEAYKGFFAHKKEEILDGLEKKKVREFIFLLLGNINILSESIVNLETMELPDKDKESETYSEFFTQTSYEILNDVFTKFIYG